MRQSKFETDVPGSNKKQELWAGAFYDSSKGGSESQGKEYADHIWQAMCHITTKRLAPRAFSAIQSEPFILSDSETIKQRLTNLSFPAVLQIGQDRFEGKFKPEAVHSLIVLGKDPDNADQFICFEKMGNISPAKGPPELW